MPNIINEKDIDLVIDELINDRKYEKTGKQMETYENIEELKFPQEYEDSGINIRDDHNKK